MALDLGSGAGVPGLALALAWPESAWILLDANGRRGRFLTRAIAELDLGSRAEVWIGRAEKLGREPGRRSICDLVVARGFAAPGVTAECAAPFLAVGGRLAVSEPPGGAAGRWPPQPLAQLGLRPLGFQAGAAGIMVLALERACPEEFPRRSPGKRPLF